METDTPIMNIFRQTVAIIDSNRPCAMAVVLDTRGSVPQHTGVRAIIDETGRIFGTVGGGPVEAKTQKRAVEAIESGRAAIFEFDMNSASAQAISICGGSMRVLVDPTLAGNRECYARVAQACEQSERGVLLTMVGRTDPSEISVKWIPEKEISNIDGFPDAETINACIKRESPKLVESESAGSPEVLIEPIVPAPILLIVGGGHVGQALAKQAALVGFTLTVLDDRPEFTNSALFPEGAKMLCGDYREELVAFPTTGDVYVVIVTRGHNYDAEALEACIRRPFTYVGLIGSKHKTGLIRQRFIESGIATEEQFNNVHAPIGLDIGAITVAEIATSIVAELVAVRRGKKAQIRSGSMAMT